MITSGLFDLMKSDAGVLAILATISGKPCIWPVKLPEASPVPAIAYTQISGDGVYSLDGANVLKTGRFQISCYAQGFTDAKKLARAAQKALVGYHGTLDDGTEVDSIRLLLELDGWEEAPQSYHCPFDVEVWYRDTGA